MRTLTLLAFAAVGTFASASSVADLDFSPRLLADNASCIVERDTDYASNDLTNVRANAFTSCCDLCRNQTGCSAWSWTDFNGGTCWLKSLVGRSRASTGVISGALPGAPTAPPPTPRPTSNSSATCNIHQDMDYEGNDIGSQQADSFEDCCDICSQRANCTAWSWNLASGGTCWLKSRTGLLFNNIGNVAGAFPNAPSEPPGTIRPLTPRPTTSSPLLSDHVQWKLRAGVIPARAVNLGGWLVGEHWMSYTSVAWKGVDFATASSGEHYAMRALGNERGTEQWDPPSHVVHRARYCRDRRGWS